MKYFSTRNTKYKISASKAIVKGLADDGGLYVPENFPEISAENISRLVAMDYRERAKYILSLFLDEFSAEEIAEYIEGAYYDGSFDQSGAAPVVNVKDGLSVLELWHGPTCAFKDMALKMLPHLLTASLDKTGEEKTAVILTATSGDTGKAALEGFKNVPRTKVYVYYPDNGVSDIQKLQMTSQEGENVGVCAVEGNFDDAQTGVKEIFTDRQYADKLEKAGYFLSSANSMNWGRLLPQICYYFSAYCDLVKEGKIKFGEYISVTVPTGNFGNILAGYYSKKMGLFINKFVCASNSNDVLTEFIKTGKYNKNRRFYTTVSPSMDILISSNLERLLFDLSDNDDAKIKEWMEVLKNSGEYSVDDTVFKKLSESFYSASCDDTKTLDTIGQYFKHHNYLVDTHTAVALSCAEEHITNNDDRLHMLVVSTASPYKFAQDVLKALSGETEKDAFSAIEKLYSFTGVAIPRPIAELKEKKPRFDEKVWKTQLKVALDKFLKLN